MYNASSNECFIQTQGLWEGEFDLAGGEESSMQTFVSVLGFGVILWLGGFPPSGLYKTLHLTNLGTALPEESLSQVIDLS